MKMKETRKKREKEGERGRRRENGSSINAAMTSPDWLFEFNMAPTWRINQGRASLAYHRAPRHFPLPPSLPPPLLLLHPTPQLQLHSLTITTVSMQRGGGGVRGELAITYPWPIESITTWQSTWQSTLKPLLDAMA